MLKEKLYKVYHYQIEKEHIARALKRQVPGDSSTPMVILDPADQTRHEDPPTTARLCTKHWQKVCDEKPYDQQEFRKRAAHYHKRLPGISWHFSDEGLQAMWKRLPSSAPGPDGIPFLAYKLAPELAIPIFRRLINRLLSPSPPKLPNNFKDL